MVCVFVCVRTRAWVCALESRCLTGTETSDPLQLELWEVVTHPVWVLGTKLGSTAGAAHSLSCSGVSRAPAVCYLAAQLRCGREVVCVLRVSVCSLWPAHHALALLLVYFLFCVRSIFYGL